MNISTSQYASSLPSEILQNGTYGKVINEFSSITSFDLNFNYHLTAEEKLWKLNLYGG